MFLRRELESTLEVKIYRYMHCVILFTDQEKKSVFKLYVLLLYLHRLTQRTFFSSVEAPLMNWRKQSQKGWPI
jgi:hypothetical protein